MVRQSSKDVEKVFKIKKIQDPTTVLWLEIVVERIRTCLGWVRQLDVRVFGRKVQSLGGSKFGYAEEGLSLIHI